MRSTRPCWVYAPAAGTDEEDPSDEFEPDNLEEATKGNDKDTSKATDGTDVEGSGAAEATKSSSWFSLQSIPVLGYCNIRNHTINNIAPKKPNAERKRASSNTFSPRRRKMTKMKPYERKTSALPKKARTDTGMPLPSPIFSKATHTKFEYTKAMKVPILDMKSVKNRKSKNKIYASDAEADAETKLGGAPPAAGRRLAMPPTPGGPWRCAANPRTGPGRAAPPSTGEDRAPDGARAPVRQRPGERPCWRSTSIARAFATRPPAPWRSWRATAPRVQPNCGSAPGPARRAGQCASA